MAANLFVHTPAHLLGSRLNFLLNRNLQPEVACQEVSIEQLDFGEIKEAVAQLQEKRLGTTLHAPFSGFNPGSNKKRLQQTAHKLCQQSLQLAELLQAHRVIFHPGIPYQAKEKVQQSWLEQALAFWPEYIEQAREIGTIITMENIYESSSALYQQLFAELASENFAHCFDVGHWNIFSDETMEDWFDNLGRYVKHLHLHDNHAESDQHLPIGSGNVDFATLFTLLEKHNLKPTMTLEAHNLGDLETSLHEFSQLKI